jgi:hypothetical protein
VADGEVRWGGNRGGEYNQQYKELTQPTHPGNHLVKCSRRHHKQFAIIPRSQFLLEHATLRCEGSKGSVARRFCETRTHIAVQTTEQYK